MKIGIGYVFLVLLTLLLVSTQTAAASSTSWQILPQTPLINGYGQADAGSAVVGGDLYMIDGYGNTAADVLNTVSIFHTSNDSWSQGPSAPISEWNLSCTSYLNQIIYCFYPGDHVFSFDTKTFQWSVLTAVVPKDLGIGLGAVVYGDGVYLIGGYITSATPVYTTNSVYRFSLSNQNFSRLAPLLVNFSGSVYSLYDGKIYALSGYSNGASINSAEVYDIRANIWSFLNTTVPTPIYGAGREASAIGALIPVVDGKNSNGVFFNSFYLYNITSNSWITMPSTHYARDGISFWVIGNRIFVGDGRDSTSVPQGLPYLEEFDLPVPTSQTTSTNTTTSTVTATSSASTVTKTTSTSPITTSISTSIQTLTTATSVRNSTSTQTSRVNSTLTKSLTTSFTLTVKHTTKHSTVRTIMAEASAANLISFLALAGTTTTVGFVLMRYKFFDK